MSNLSSYQFKALVSLLDAPMSNKELAIELGITEHSVRPMMIALRDRGLVTPAGKATKRQRPCDFTYTLTAAGRLQASGAA